MKNKLCLITGGTTGIGLYMALGLAQRGAQVLIVGRRPDHGRRAVERIEREAQHAEVRWLQADLSIMAQVGHLAAEVRDHYGALDVLINNVGGFFFRRRQTAEGLEQTIALNHLSHFLLTHMLLDRLRQAENARIIETSSAAQHDGRIHFDDLQLERNYSGWRAYAQSKLANVMFAFELSERLRGEPITVNAFHPGFTATNLAKNHWLVRPFVSMMYLLFGRHPRQGAETGVYLATSPEVAQMTGEYFVDKRLARSAPAAHDGEQRRRLWEISRGLLDLQADV